MLGKKGRSCMLLHLQALLLPDFHVSSSSGRRLLTQILYCLLCMSLSMSDIVYVCLPSALRPLLIFSLSLLVFAPVSAFTSAALCQDLHASQLVSQC